MGTLSMGLKNFITIVGLTIFLTLIFTCGSLNAQDTTDKARFGGKAVPVSVTDLMDKSYPGWQPKNNLYLLDSPITDLDTTVAFPNHVWADFNDDGEQDHVLFAERQTEKGMQELMIAFVSGENGMASHELCAAMEPAYCGNMIWKLDKGDRLYSWKKAEYVEAPSDGVHSIVLEKGRESYLYINGSFERSITGD